MESKNGKRRGTEQNAGCQGLGDGGGGGMNWEIRIDIYTLICIK